MENKETSDLFLIDINIEQQRRKNKNGGKTYFVNAI